MCSTVYHSKTLVEGKSEETKSVLFDELDPIGADDIVDGTFVQRAAFWDLPRTTIQRG
jgi:hypothetical protein